MATTELQVLVLPVNYGDKHALDAVKLARGNMMHTTPATTISIPAILDEVYFELTFAVYGKISV